MFDETFALPTSLWMPPPASHQPSKDQSQPPRQGLKMQMTKESIRSL